MVSKVIHCAVPGQEAVGMVESRWSDLIVYSHCLMNAVMTSFCRPLFPFKYAYDVAYIVKRCMGYRSNADECGRSPKDGRKSLFIAIPGIARKPIFRMSCFFVRFQ